MQKKTPQYYRENQNNVRKNAMWKSPKKQSGDVIES